MYKKFVLWCSSSDCTAHGTCEDGRGTCRSACKAHEEKIGECGDHCTCCLAVIESEIFDCLITLQAHTKETPQCYCYNITIIHYQILTFFLKKKDNTKYLFGLHSKHITFCKTKLTILFFIYFLIIPCSMHAKNGVCGCRRHVQHTLSRRKGTSTWLPRT